MNLTHEIRSIVAGALFIIAFGVFSYVVFSKSSTESGDDVFTGSWACSADYAVCPDGTEVYRTPPYCQFAECKK